MLELRVAVNASYKAFLVTNGRAPCNRSNANSKHVTLVFCTLRTLPKDAESLFAMLKFACGGATKLFRLQLAVRHAKSQKQFHVTPVFRTSRSSTQADRAFFAMLQIACSGDCKLNSNFGNNGGQAKLRWNNQCSAWFHTSRSLAIFGVDNC